MSLQGAHHPIEMLCHRRDDRLDIGVRRHLVEAVENLVGGKYCVEVVPCRDCGPLMEVVVHSTPLYVEPQHDKGMWHCMAVGVTAKSRN